MESSDLAAAARVGEVLDGLAQHPEVRRAGEVHQHVGAESVRVAVVAGHVVRIRTIYEITVDGRPFPIEASVDNAGRVHYHGLPTRSFPSAVELVADAIENFPDDFAVDPGEPPPDPPPGTDPHGGHDHGGHDGHDHGPAHPDGAR